MFRIKEDFEGEPDAVIEASGDGFCWDIGGAEEGENFGSQGFAAGIGVSFFVVLGWEAVEAGR